MVEQGDGCWLLVVGSVCMHQSFLYEFVLWLRYTLCAALRLLPFLLALLGNQASWSDSYLFKVFLSL